MNPPPKNAQPRSSVCIYTRRPKVAKSVTAISIHPSSSFIEGVGFPEHVSCIQLNPSISHHSSSADPLLKQNLSSSSPLPIFPPFLHQVTKMKNPHKNNATKAAATAKPANPAGAKLAAPPTNGSALVVVIGKPELAATPVPAMVPFWYPAAATAEAELVVVVVPEGAAAGRPLTGLTPRIELLEGAGIGLKRTLGTTVVEREVEEEALSTRTVLTTVFWIVV